MQLEQGITFANLQITVEEAFELQAQLTECLRLVATNKLVCAGSKGFDCAMSAQPGKTASDINGAFHFIVTR